LLVAFFTIKHGSHKFLSAFWRFNPWARAEGRVMSDMLAMAAIQIGYPILLVILVKSDYWLIHEIEQERKSMERIGKREEIYTEWKIGRW
jgi:hypothetical protein